jgi:DNA-binding CsgD family transcriptional regulator/PAS domain-containing protein
MPALMSGLALAPNSEHPQTTNSTQNRAVPWRQTLLRLKDACSADAAWVVQYNTEARRGRILVAVNIAAAAAESYRDTFCQMDPWLENEFCFQDVGVTIAGHDVLSDAALQQTEFYRDWLEPQGLFHHYFGVLARTENVLMLIVLAWNRGKQPLGNSVSAVLGAILPACAANWRLEGLLQAARSETRAVWAATDHLNCGIVLMDPGGRVLGHNKIAREILDARDGLHANDGFLVASRPPNHLRLQSALRRLYDPTVDGAPITAFTVPKNDGEGYLHVILKWSVDPPSSTTRAPSIIVAFLSDPTRHKMAPADLLSSLFALTPVEAEIALLLSEGLSVNEVADRLRSSKNTVRSYLKAIFQKTGARRQASLVRVILMGIGAVRPTPTSEPGAPSAARSQTGGREPAQILPAFDEVDDRHARFPQTLQCRVDRAPDRDQESKRGFPLGGKS